VQNAARNQNAGQSFTLFADQVTTVSSDESGKKGKPKPKMPGNKVMASRGAQ
jgi:hypothetical protein